MTDSARQRSADFLRVADQFCLGDLITEAAHPVTARLSETARDDLLEAIADAVFEALLGGGRIFFTGCGSTGRLSILLDSIWRDFWQHRRAAGQGVCPGDWQDRTFSVMAGGDFALIKAVEGFEDYTVFGRKQIRDLGVRAGDVVFAITEGGETSFVLGTAWEAVEAGAKVWLVYNNPDDHLCRHVERSREVIVDPRIDKLNLTTGPMAISGSTRMQATTIQLCVLLTVLERLVRRLLASAAGAGREEVESLFLTGLESLHQSLLSDDCLGQLASLVQAEADAYRAGGRTHYLAERFAIDVLTDTTERSPTFCTPPFRKLGDRRSSESLSFLFVPGRTTPEAWRWLLKRSPRCLDWTRRDIEGLVPPGHLERTARILAGITQPELLRFGIGGDDCEDRPWRENDYCLSIAAETETAWPSRGPRKESGQAAATNLRDAALLFGPGNLAREWGTATVVRVRVPDTGWVLDGLTRVAVKVVLNALSTCVMVRLGRVMGNTMIYVVPSNLKLIDRATRYISRLAGLDYEEANRRLFEALEHVEPRLIAGQTCPPVVALAVLGARRGKGLDDAEQAFRDGEEA